eukprot:CAMPEP_0184322478 /NCGR_PEP_ID=MMETSP1049-20130417/124657_1 /TAXON_ID=77928 /ORGANISM="Proteomonas sulcata, Strain CCMP704" /LENGTH=34 /DNA_ID= /DNA_START= /DNA_END= /DNA_ORIENTATION=
MTGVTNEEGAEALAAPFSPAMIPGPNSIESRFAL